MHSLSSIPCHRGMMALMNQITDPNHLIPFYTFQEKHRLQGTILLMGESKSVFQLDLTLNNIIPDILRHISLMGKEAKSSKRLCIC